MPLSGRWRGWFPLTLLLLTGALYAGTAGHEFTLDDGVLVRDNPLIRDLRGLPTLFASDYWEPEAKVGLYRPLVSTSYALNFALGGLEPLGYHLLNIALHAAVSVGVWAVYRRLCGSALVAGAAAALFAAHGLHTEAVANVVGRAELLAALFYLLALLGYVEGQVRGGRGGAALYAASLGAYLLALLSKESALTLVAVLFLYDFAYGEGSGALGERLSRTLRRHWRPYLGYVVLTLLYLGLRLLALGAAGGVPAPPALDNPLVTLELPWRVLTALEVGLRYLGLLVFPLRLSYDYSYDQIPLLASLADPRAWLVLGLWGAVLGIVVRSYRRRRDLFFALAFYLVTFSPVSNLLVVIGTIMGERLVYLPSAGFCLALTLLIQRGCGALPLQARGARALFAGVLVLVVGLHATRTLVRNADWRSNERLYLHDVSVVPKSAKALNNAGKVLQDLGQQREAIAEFERAIQIDPSYPTPYLNWSYSLSALGRDDEAIRLLERELRRGEPNPFVYNNLGFLLVDKEIDIKRGVTLLETARQLRADDPDLLDSLGWGYYKLGRLEEAQALLRRSLELNDWSGSTPDRRAHLVAIEEGLRRGAARGTGPRPHER